MKADMSSRVVGVVTVYDDSHYVLKDGRDGVRP